MPRIVNLKELIFILSIIFLYSCQPIIKNDKKTLEKVFAMAKFDIEIQNWGCFGGSKEHFSVLKENNGYILKSNRTGKSHLVSQLKMDSLKSFLKTKIGIEENGGCTSSEYIRLGTFFTSVDYEHNYCSGMEATIIDNLLR